MRVFVTVGAVFALGLGVWGCSGSGYSTGNNSGSPTAPSTSGAVRANNVGINGPLSFSPSPGPLPAGQPYLTFSQPVTVPGVVLPARPYTFRLAGSPSDGH